MRTVKAIALFCLLGAVPAHAAVITTFYGDDDGFGLGATVSIDPTVSHDDPGEAPFTDVRLIGSGIFVAPPFTPLGGFDPYAISGTILSASLTMSAGGWVTGPTPVDGPQRLMLDGVDIASSFVPLFTNGSFGDIETRTLALDASLFPLLSDGFVSLAGTHLSEQSGTGSFQIDYLRLDIVTSDVPVPPTALLLGLGLAAFVARRTRRSA